MAGELEKNLIKGIKDLMKKDTKGIGKKLKGKSIKLDSKKAMDKAIREISGMEMGGEVMDTTKSMPVGMMDGGKVKPMKMNMGGVVPGRGGKFKGVM